MDKIQVAILRSDLEQQLNLIRDVYEVVRDRARRAAAQDPGYVESLAFQLHNFYSAVEDLMKHVAQAFENNISETSHWHAQLLSLIHI